MHLALGKRLYWILALFALAAAAVTMTSGFISAEKPGPAQAIQTCDRQDEADDAAVAATDNLVQQCGDQQEADDGKDLLPQAGITIDQALAAARSAASGPVGEVDLEYHHGKLVFNVDIGDKDVKVDANSGSIVSVDADD